MHAEARTFVAKTLTGRSFGSVIEVGGRNINGGIRDLIDCDTYTSLDLYDGPGVDVVADCQQWQPDQLVDLVVCCEVLEHAPDPRGVVEACLSYLARGGLLVLTCAGPGRAPHSGHDGSAVRDGEHYGNISPEALRDWLAGFGGQVMYDPGPCDVYATATKPRGRRDGHTD